MKTEKQPYRITIEQYEYKYSVEVDHSDIKHQMKESTVTLTQP